MPTEIQHFIGGQFVAGKSGRTAPVFNPATGEQQGVVPLASTAEVDEAVAMAQAAFPKWAMTTPLRRARILNRFLRLLEEHQERIAADHHRRARQGLLRRAGRDRARHRGGRVRDRRAAAAQGRGHRERRHARRQPLPAPAAWASWPGSRRSTSRPWCRCGCSRSPWPAATASSSRSRSACPRPPDPGRAAQGGRRPGRRVPGGARRQGGGRRHPAPSRHRRGELRRLDARSPSTSTRPRPSTGSAARRWAGPRTT